MFKKEFKKSMITSNKEKSILEIENSINPAFRQLIDLLLFTDRMDFDENEFHLLLKDNYISNVNYILDRFKKSSLIKWINDCQIWYYRINFLFSANERMLIKNIESYINDCVYLALRFGKTNRNSDISYIQFVQLAKVKKERSLFLFDIKKTLLEVPCFIDNSKVYGIIKDFIPYVFPDIETYLLDLSKKVSVNYCVYDCVLYFEEQGFKIDKTNMVIATKNLIFGKYPTLGQVSTLISLLNDPEILLLIKSSYSAKYNKKLKKIIADISYQSFDSNHMKLVRVLISLDPTLAAQILNSYIDSLIEERFTHKKAVSDKIVKMLKAFPQMQPKKALLKLISEKHSNLIINQLADAFPELKKFVVFI